MVVMGVLAGEFLKVIGLIWACFMRVLASLMGVLLGYPGLFVGDRAIFSALFCRSSLRFFCLVLIFIGFIRAAQDKWSGSYQ